MIRALRAIAWVRWRALAHSLRGKVRGDRFEKFGRIAELMTPVVYALLLIPLCVALTLGAFVGGWQMARSGGSSDVVIVFTRVMLGLVSVGVLLAPLVRSVQGLQFGTERLMLLPISRRVLHLAEVVGGVTDPWVLLVLPALVLLPAGLMLGGALRAGLLVLLAGVLFVATMGALGSLCSNGLMLLFRDRRRAEWVTLVFIASIVVLAFLPAALEDRVAPRATGDDSQPDFERQFGWAAGWPSELHGKSVELAVEGRSGAALARLAVLGLLAGLCFALSDSFHRRLVASPEQSPGRRTGTTSRVRRWSLPGAGPVVSAVALAQVRTVLRTVRGKIAVYFVVVVVILITMIFDKRLLNGIPGSQVMEVGPLVLLLGVIMTLMSLMPILMNQFGVDGAGLTLLFLAPISGRDLVRGKILGCALLAGISLSLCLAGAVLVRPGGSPSAWLAMLLVCASAFVLLAPACSLTAAYFPKRSNLNRLGKAGDPHGVANLIGLSLTALTVGFPVALYVSGIFLAKSPPRALTLVAIWFVVALGLSLPLTRLATRAVAHRRENLFLVATQGEA